ncbi:hypothetical protein J7K41_01550 [Candidatus Micrarchaeota archaeon]|nr:hypothetical protein [Candidatus Micrarchaeota archaeon]
MTVKGQVATEYLIVLAIVVIISLIVVGVLRSFLELKPGIESVKSKIEWSSKDITLDAYTVYSNGTAVLMLSNNLNYPVRITSVGVGKDPVPLPSPVYIDSGMEETVVVPPSATVSGLAGDKYSLDVTIKYTHAKVEAIRGTVRGKVYGVYEGPS